MASIAGLDADAWGARALIAQHEGSEKGELLKQALKKALAATGATLVSSGIDAAQVTNATHDMGLYLIRCIFCKPCRVDHGGARTPPHTPHRPANAIRSAGLTKAFVCQKGGFSRAAYPSANHARRAIKRIRADLEVTSFA